MLVQEEEHPSDQACDHTSSQSDKPGRHQLLRITEDLCEWFIKNKLEQLKVSYCTTLSHHLVVMDGKQT